MFCRNCGNPVDPNAAYCMRCGVPLGKGANYCPNCGSETVPEAVVCVKCGVPLAHNYASVGTKSKLVAGLLGIFLGGFGVHSFYLGYTKKGVWQLIVTLLTCGIGSIWGFIEGILILCGTHITTDAEGYPLSD